MERRAQNTLFKKLKNAPAKSVIQIAYSQLRRYDHKTQAKLMAIFLMRWCVNKSYDYNEIFDILLAILTTFKFHRSLLSAEVYRLAPAPLTIFTEKILHILLPAPPGQKIEFTIRQSKSNQFCSLVYIDRILKQKRRVQGKLALKRLDNQYHWGSDIERLILRFWIPLEQPHLSALEIINIWAEFTRSSKQDNLDEFIEIMAQLMHKHIWSEFKQYYIPNYVFFERIALHVMMDPPGKYAYVKRADDLFNIQ